MRLNTDNKQRLKSLFTFFLEFYKVLMGAYLVVFVPRLCDDGVCSINDNIYNDDVMHRVALGFNSFCFLLFLNLYRVELQRENWCIKYLDIDVDKAIENLDDEIENYPVIKQEMAALNKSYKNAVMVCGGSAILNTGISLYDLSTHWAGSPTLTPLLSSILLIFMKLYGSYFVAGSSLENERAYSAYMSGPKTYNAIDSDFIEGELYVAPEVATDAISVKVETISEADSPRRRIQRPGTPVPNASSIGHIESKV